MGKNFGFEQSASAVFREIAERVPAYAGLRYPVLKDESNPVQAKYAVVESERFGGDITIIARRSTGVAGDGDKETVTPSVGHELFKIGTLTDKVPQFHLLAAGNPRPETVRVSPLYQITVDADLRAEVSRGRVNSEW